MYGKNLSEYQLLNQVGYARNAVRFTHPIGRSVTHATIHNPLSQRMVTGMSDNNQWKRGLPKGKITQKMLDETEVYYSPIGVVWHRKKQQPKAERGERD